MTNIFDKSIGFALKIAALVLIVSLLAREFRGGVATSATRPAPVYQADWRDIASVGHSMGSERAQVVLVEFGDFECPACRMFASNIPELREQFGDTLAIVYVHFPLAYHRFAVPAARAAECAADQGYFAEFHDLLFAKQDSLGLKSWASYAIEAGLTNDSRFEECLQNPASMARIEQGLEAGQRIGVSGTPALMFNGWLFRGGMTIQETSTVIRDLRLLAVSNG